MKAKKKPVIIKAGRGIRAKIWTNESKKGEWKSVEIVRTYKDKNEKLHDTSTFSASDLPLVAWVATKAFDQMQASETDEKE